MTARDEQGRSIHSAAGRLHTGGLRSGRAGGRVDNKGETTETFDNGRGERIRTFDPLHPMQVRYQAAPRPDRVTSLTKTNGSGELSVVGQPARAAVRM